MISIKFFENIVLLGYFAAFCTTISFLPQALKIWKSNSSKDISLSMFVIFTIGVICWLIYGILINDLPIVIANSFTLILSLFILIHKLVNR
jgi:MtN3 and saliva related transmembrane protein